jgi:cation:H+ antiporter
MILQIILIILGFLLLIKGADFLVEGASNIAKRFHIPEIVIGLTIVSIGTSMPELIVSSVAAVEGHSDIAIGNVVGSNLANLFFILGVCAIIKPLVFQKQTKLIENPVTIFATAILLYFCINGTNEISNVITKKEGFILLIF